MRGTQQRRFKQWCGVLNSLDPFIHRAVFQYWRSTSLANADFWEDSATALDGVASVAAQFAQQRLGVRGDVRAQLADIFGLMPHEQRILNELYRLRSKYGGHPSPSKWWDFGEMYGEWLDEAVPTVGHLLSGLASAERSHRAVEPDPADWSSWFLDNASVLLEAAWFLDV